MCDQQKYFVFTFDLSKNEVGNMVGIREALFSESATVYTSEEEVNLPRQFMLGKRYKGLVYRSKATKSRLAVLIPIDARPLAL